MQFTVGQLSKIFSISAQSIHSYVDMGILPCIRDGKGYRYFDEYGFQILGTIIKHRNAGLPLKESSFVYDNADEQEIYSRLLQQKQELKKELALVTKRLYQLDNQIDCLSRHLLAPSQIEFIQMDKMIRFNLGKVEHILQYKNDRMEEISRWYSNLFYTQSSLKLNYNNSTIESYEYALIIDQRLFDELIDMKSDEVEEIPSGLVASIICEYTNEISINLLEKEITNFFVHYPTYSLRDAPFTRLLTSYNDINKNKVNIFELILPIK